MRLKEISAEPVLVETAETSYPFKLMTGTSGAERYVFTSRTGDRYEVEFRESMPGAVNIDFGNMSEHERGGDVFGVLGVPDRFQIFGTILAITRQYIEKNQPHEVMFSCRDDVPSRVKLYRAFAGKMAKHFPDYDFIGEVHRSGRVRQIYYRQEQESPSEKHDASE